MTQGAAAKILKQMTQEQSSFGDKLIAQQITPVAVTMAEGSITATFYRVMTVINTPLVMPVQLSFQLNQGERTPWNPAGLYINGIIEYESSSP